MAREGLRTLVVAKKVLTEDQYQDFEVCVYASMQYLHDRLNVLNEGGAVRGKKKKLTWPQILQNVIKVKVDLDRPGTKSLAICCAKC